MKRVFLMLAFMASLSAVQAQEQVQFRVSYDCDAQIQTNKEDRVTNRWVLNVGQSTAEFYCKTAQDYLIKRDSLKSIRSATMQEANAKMAEIRGLNRNSLSRSLMILHWNLSEVGKYTVTDNLVETMLRYEEQLPALSWNMMDGSKEIEGYACKKAQAEVYGRTWTVWYTDEIPLSFGPWLLGGLPGLVLEAEDTENAFHFTLAGLEQVADQTVIDVKKGKDAIKCSRKRFLEMRQESDTNRWGFIAGGNNYPYGMRVTGDKIVGWDDNGEEFVKDEVIEDTRIYFDRNK